MLIDVVDIDENCMLHIAARSQKICAILLSALDLEQPNPVSHE